jgi:hypothetical protein
LAIITKKAWISTPKISILKKTIDGNRLSYGLKFIGGKFCGKFCNWEKEKKYSILESFFMKQILKKNLNFFEKCWHIWTLFLFLK